MTASKPTSTDQTRRKFIATGTAAAVSLAGSQAFGSPFVRTSKTINAIGETVIGQGDYQYKIDHQFCELPDRYKWQTTHNVAVDSANNLYVIHEGRGGQKDHPSIFVFDPEGKFIRAFGSEFQGGGHGIEIRKEGSDEYMYVAAYQGVKSFAKMTLDGSIVWYKKAPMESGVYAEGENTSTRANWSRKGFLPTNFAFLENGGFLLADGYGDVPHSRIRCRRKLGSLLWWCRRRRRSF